MEAVAAKAEATLIRASAHISYMKLNFAFKGSPPINFGR
jgi:hypothetical protein